MTKVVHAQDQEPDSVRVKRVERATVAGPHKREPATMRDLAVGPGEEVHVVTDPRERRG